MHLPQVPQDLARTNFLQNDYEFLFANHSQKILDAVCKNSGSKVSALLSLVVTAVGIPRRNTDAANVPLV